MKEWKCFFVNIKKEERKLCFASLARVNELCGKAVSGKADPNENYL